MVMIHRVDDSDDASNGTIFLPSHSFSVPDLLITCAHVTDPFDPTEPNPQLTNAADSSLWELYTQKSHYHAAAATLARVFEEAFTKPSYALEDFLDHTYSTVRACMPAISL